MRIVVAPDKFKGCMTSDGVASAMAAGAGHAFRDLAPEFDLAPMADGGEGTTAALVASTGGTIRRATVTGPLGAPVSAEFGRLGDGRTFVLEMAAASGLALLSPTERDPLRTSTRGTGELLRASADAGARRIIVGIGGSATNDGGAGVAQALGYRLLDREGRELPPGGGALGDLDRIDPDRRDRRFDAIEVDVACDVDNPLTGPRGATQVYGPQKFRPDRPPDPEALERLDHNLARWAEILRRDLGMNVAETPGAGAAGGLGAGLSALVGGRLLRGVELVIDALGLARRVEGADLVLTGEGSLDSQTAEGKVVAGVGRLAERFGVPAFAIAGRIGEGAEAVLGAGISAYFAIPDGPASLEALIADAPRLIEHAAEQASRAFLAGRVREGPR